MTDAIRVMGLRKGYGTLPVLDGLELSVESGDFLTIFGSNGVGKTTLLKVLSTVALPDAGQVYVHGLEVRRDPLAVRAIIGVLSHQPLLYGELTVRENLRFYGRMYRVLGLSSRIEEVACQLGVQDKLDTRVHTLSHGVQKRAAIARAILHDPSVLLADEPETGLDPASVASLGTTLAREGVKRRTVVMATHNLAQGLVLGNRVAVLAQGRIVYQGQSGAVDVATLRQLCDHPMEAAH
ncbi:ABC transporter ATP-binding protein [Chloroflexota bacterium]